MEEVAQTVIKMSRDADDNNILWNWSEKLNELTDGEAILTGKKQQTFKKLADPCI